MRTLLIHKYETTNVEDILVSKKRHGTETYAVPYFEGDKKK